MPSLPIIEATVPQQTPAIPAKVYDTWVITQVSINSVDAGRNLYSCSATLSKALVRQDGTKELSPTADPVTLFIPDVYALAGTDADLATVMGAIVLYVIKYGTQQGAL